MSEQEKRTKNNKKHDHHFQKVNIKHDPAAESARAAFNRRDRSEDPDKTI